MMSNTPSSKAMSSSDREKGRENWRCNDPADDDDDDRIGLSSDLPLPEGDATHLALVVQKSTGGEGTGSADPYANQKVHVVVWATSRRRLATTTTSQPLNPSPNTESWKSGGGLEWTYWHLWDHPRHFDHLQALLHRLAPLASIQVACTDSQVVLPDRIGRGSVSSSSKSSTLAPKIPSPLTRVVERLLDLLQQQAQDPTLVGPTSSSRSISSSSAASRSGSGTLVQWHARLPLSSSLEQDDRFLQQWLESNVQANAAARVDLSTDTALRQAWRFFYHVTVPMAQARPSLSPGDPVVIQAGRLTTCLQLNAQAASAIHLWPPAGWGARQVVGGSEHNHSIASVLMQGCLTGPGRRLLEQWLRQPLTQLPLLQARQDAVTFWVQHGLARQAVREEGLQLWAGRSASSDVARWVPFMSLYAQPHNSSAALADDEEEIPPEGPSGRPRLPTSTRKALQCLYDLYLLGAQKVPALAEALHTALSSPMSTTSPERVDPEEEDGRRSITGDGLLAQLDETLQHIQGELQRLVQLAQAVLDLEAAPREFLVRADYRDELHDVVQDLQQVEADLQACQEDMNENWARASGRTTAVRLETQGEGPTAEYQFRLPDTNDSKILQQHLGSTVTVHRLLKNGVYFTTKALRQLSTHKQSLLAEYDRLQQAVVTDAMQVAATYQSVVERASDAVALLDVLVGLAHVAAYSSQGYCRPVLTDGEEDGLGIELKQARHPCVELQENVEYIPNDIRLILGESSFLLVTGPNMGGKSTYIRALGAIVTMAQIGAYVPCASAKINICHQILARVGAGDQQDRGISTFMAEMLEASSILRTATKRSLIIIDELGRGTSTFDGYGLARAISEYIIQRIGCMTVFATHFHELTALEDQERVVQNCHVTAQKGSQGLTFLYEVKPGPCLESFGILVAQMANVPAQVIQDAKRKAQELENFEYRKKRREGDDNSKNDRDDNQDVEAEEAAAALAFVNRFRRLPQAVLEKSYTSDVEKQRALLEMIA